MTILQSSIRKVDTLAFHTWLDEHDPTWEVVGIEWINGTGSSPVNRKAAEWIANQLQLIISANSDIDILISYSITSENVAMLARLTWTLTALQDPAA